MNNSIRDATLSAAAREVMRPLALNVAQKILHGKLYDSTALSLLKQAIEVLIHERDEDYSPPEGWEDYYQDCLDLIQSYHGVTTDDGRMENILRSLRGMSSMDVVRQMVSLEARLSFLMSQQTKQGA